MRDMLRRVLLVGTHTAAFAVGFALGIYALPILTAPPGPDKSALHVASSDTHFKARFERNLKVIDFFHWGEGEVRVMRSRVPCREAS